MLNLVYFYMLLFECYNQKFIYSLILILLMIEVIYGSRDKISRADINKGLPNSLSWINSFNLSDNEINLLGKKLNIPVYLLKHSLDNNEITRIEKYKSYDLIILKIPINKKVKTLGIVKHRNYVLTVCSENTGMKLDKEDLSKDSDYLLKEILNNVIKSFSKRIEDLEDNVNHLEDITFNEKISNDPKEIFYLKKELMYIKKGLNADNAIISQLDNIDNIKIELNQLIDTENTLTFRMTEVMNMYMTFISNRLNEIMKSFTVIASLLLLPMLISGIYGMNIPIPMQNSNGAFYIILGIMLFLMVLTLLYFK